MYPSVLLSDPSASVSSLIEVEVDSEIDRSHNRLDMTGTDRAEVHCRRVPLRHEMRGAAAPYGSRLSGPRTGQVCCAVAAAWMLGC